MQLSVPPEDDHCDPNSSYSYTDHNPYIDNDEVQPNFVRRPTDMLRRLANYSEKPPLDLHETDQMDDFWDEEEEDEGRFVNFSLLSHIAMQLRDKVPRGTHVKGSIPYPRAFTGKDIVVRDFYLFIAILSQLFSLVHYPNPNPKRIGNKPRSFDKRPASGSPSRSKPPKPAVLL